MRVARRPLARAVRTLRLGAGFGLIALAGLAWVLPGAGGLDPDAVPLRLVASAFVVLVGTMVLPRA